MVVMSHQHVDDHVYMKIRLIRLISIRSEKNRFAVHESPRHGLGLKHRSPRGVGFVWSPAGF
jgi:hypothetical protein